VKVEEVVEVPFVLQFNEKKKKKKQEKSMSITEKITGQKSSHFDHPERNKNNLQAKTQTDAAAGGRGKKAY